MWEYRVETSVSSYDSYITKYLSEIGREGWELVSVVVVNDYDPVYRYMFKRRLPDVSGDVLMVGQWARETRR